MVKYACVSTGFNFCFAAGFALAELTSLDSAAIPLYLQVWQS